MVGEGPQALYFGLTRRPIDSNQTRRWFIRCGSQTLELETAQPIHVRGCLQDFPLAPRALQIGLFAWSPFH
jgi:hypothetical protein